MAAAVAGPLLLLLLARPPPATAGDCGKSGERAQIGRRHPGAQVVVGGRERGAGPGL